MPAFHTSCISVQAIKFPQMFLKSPFHKEMPATQNTKLIFVQGKLGVRLSYACLQPAQRMLRHTICNRHALVRSNFTWFPSLKSYHKGIGLRLAWGIFSCVGCVKAVPLVNSFSWCLLSLAALHNGSSVDMGFASCSTTGVHSSLFSWTQCSTGTLAYMCQGDISSGNRPNCLAASHSSKLSWKCLLYLTFLSYLITFQLERSCTTFQKNSSFSTLPSVTKIAYKQSHFCCLRSQVKSLSLISLCT